MHLSSPERILHRFCCPPMNVAGLTSAEVIHYQKLNDGTVFVVGFSPTHEPFPKSDAPHYNPLFTESDD